MDRQTLMVRRGVAAGVAVLVVILLVLGVRGCLNARKEQAIKDYVGDVSSLVKESDQQSRQFFQLLSGSAGGRERAVDVATTLNTYRSASDELVDRARKVDHPDELNKAQRYLVETLEFRRDGIADVANALPTALSGRLRRQGTDKVTADLQTFLTSDVIYTQRFIPDLAAVLDDHNLRDEVRLPTSQFLPNVDWLQPSFVADRITRIRTGRAAAATPGVHGDGLGSVSLGGQALSPTGSATIKLTKDLAFDVQVMNQGESTETDVGVKVTVGKGADAIDLDATIDSIARGETKDVKLPLSEQPPTGENLPIDVEVVPVPGEKKTDNNKQTFSAIFTS